ncbi:MAG: response regulator, partial [Kiritimatiellaceae bacterium]|nr:response regulator [Kiritimatiellaceae bacterium]
LREASALLSIILDSAGRAAELASQLLVFGRKKAHAMVATDVHALIHATAEILRNTLDRRIQLSEDLTQQTPVVLCDAAQVQNVFLNLGINASHAMAHGGKLSFTSRIVELSYQYCSQSAFNLVPGRYVEIMVTDTGDGIRPEHMNRIFEPFFSTKGQGKGTGLGLAIAYGTIQQHGGEILVQSQVGFGTTFIVRLPLVEHGPVEQVTQNFLVPGSGCILVVDDEQVMRSTAEGFLKRCGYDVLLAENGKEAVDIFRAQAGRVSLVVCDMVMPVMNGLDCFKNLQEIDPNVQYVLVTGFAKPEDIAKMNEMGMAGVIKKPYRGSELSRVVANVLKQDRPVR